MSMEAGLPDKPRLIREGATPKIGIVHFGPGAFFRAFNAVYTQEAMAAEGGDWGICAVSLQSPTARDQLMAQGCAFTSVTLAPEGPTPQVIGAIAHALVAPEDPSAVLKLLGDPAVRIVSLTITEKGYCVDRATGRLQMDHPGILADLANPDQPRTALGFITQGLATRRAQGHAPFTVMSCDNLPDNGALTRQMVLDFAQVRDPELALWISENVPFPSTMVDRITPATTEQDVDDLADAAGYFDPACVMHEPFRQWVIEDDFVKGEHPAWDAAGAQFVSDVAAFELMKLRCLNGTHSSLAYLGYLAGHETIADCVADAPFAGLCTQLWRDEILPTLPQPEGEDLPAYCASLLTRYRNPAIRHRTWQIAMDGSQKLPQRLLGTVTSNLAAGRDSDGLALAVAAWMRYVGGVDEAGRGIDVRDPLAERLKALSDGARTPAAKVAALLGMEDVFAPALAAHPSFRKSVIKAYEGLCEHGARAMVQELIKD